MNKVLVIGPTYKTQVITTEQKLQESDIFNCSYTNDIGGGQFLVAHNLAVMETDTYFITRLAYDEAGNRLLKDLDENNVVVNFTSNQLSSTAQKTYLFSKEGLKIFDDIPYNSYPSLEDRVPAEFFMNVDYALVNIINSNYFHYILKNYPKMHYICDNNIPSDEILENVEGVILDEEHVKNYVDERDFASFADKLLYKGINYLLVTDKGKGVYIYTRNGNDYLAKDKSGPYYLGCHEVFVSMFLASLSNGLPFSQALNNGLNLTNDFSYTKAIKLEKEFF